MVIFLSIVTIVIVVVIIIIMNSIIWQKWAVSKFLVNRSFLSYIQGEYIAPEKIENIYTQCSMVHQVFVHGDSKKVGSGISCVDVIVSF